ncbi:MAG TPA: SAM-dependent methyltransferase [Acidimicrobiia bacterium]|nr:SAM-dependent methyltransferase [Acidimicrobiia bacterium]
MKTPNSMDPTVPLSLKDLIQNRISSEGPIPFEVFMEMALYHPDLGFFASNRLRSEMAGDFLTSPEVSALFGETLASYVSVERERIGEPFRLIEVGAGSGSLLRSLLSKLDVEVLAIDASPAARASLRDVVPDAAIGTELPERIRGVILANELVDNLPMALSQRVGVEWRERWVGSDEEGLALVDVAPRPEIAAWLHAYAGEVLDGGWVEVQLAANSWLTDALARLEQGSVVVIDYGDTAENLLPRRQDGTLRTYRAHHLGPHPLDEPGETDITADVNFSALMATAEKTGAEVRLLRQDDFLTELGLRDRLSELRHTELEAARSGDSMARLQARSMKTEAETLLHPRGLGDFRVLIGRR